MMAGVEGKGVTKIVNGNPLNGEVEVINGRIKVLLVPLGPATREGTGSAQLKGGIESKGQVVITAGAVRMDNT